jgi:hypothetical protein
MRLIVCATTALRSTAGEEAADAFFFAPRFFADAFAASPFSSVRIPASAGKRT